MSTLQEDAEAIAHGLSAFAAQMRQASQMEPDTRCVIMPPYNPDWEAAIRLAALIVLDLDPHIVFDWSYWNDYDN